MRFWSESIAKMDRDEKIGPMLKEKEKKKEKEARLMLKCCSSRSLRVKAVGLCTQTESIPVCLHFALWCE